MMLAASAAIRASSPIKRSFPRSMQIVKAAFFGFPKCVTLKRIFIFNAKPQNYRKGDAMYFTNGDHRAIDSLMRGTPGFDH